MEDFEGYREFWSDNTDIRHVLVVGPQSDLGVER